MFNHYIEVQIMKENRFDKQSNKLLQNVLEYLHGEFSRKLRENGFNDCAISLPQYNKDKMFFGTIIRVFSNNKDSLRLLKLDELFSGDDNDFNYNVTSIRRVRNRDYKFAVYRKLPSNSPCQTIRQYMNRNNLNDKVLEEKLIAERKQNVKIKYPYINFRSKSQKSNFPLIIKKEFVDKENEGTSYSSYGLGVTEGKNMYTVPEW